jgi:hypothetical protein
MTFRQDFYSDGNLFCLRVILQRHLARCHAGRMRVHSTAKQSPSKMPRVPAYQTDCGQALLCGITPRYSGFGSFDLTETLSFPCRQKA